MPLLVSNAGEEVRPGLVHTSTECISRVLLDPKKAEEFLSTRHNAVYEGFSDALRARGWILTDEGGACRAFAPLDLAYRVIPTVRGTIYEVAASAGRHSPRN